MWRPLLQIEIQRPQPKVNNQSLDVRTLESKTFPASAASVWRSAHFYNVASHLMLWKWMRSHKSSADYDVSVTADEQNKKKMHVNSN